MHGVRTVYQMRIYDLEYLKLAAKEGDDDDDDEEGDDADDEDDEDWEDEE